MLTDAPAAATVAVAADFTFAVVAGATVFFAFRAIFGARRLFRGGFRSGAVLPSDGMKWGARLPFAPGALCGLGMGPSGLFLCFVVARAGRVAEGVLKAWEGGLPSQTSSPWVAPVKLNTWRGVVHAGEAACGRFFAWGWACGSLCAWRARGQG